MNSPLRTRILTVAAALLLACSAQAITITAADLIGTVVPGTPSGDAQETNRLNYFINLNNGTPTPAPDGNTYTLDPNTAVDNVPAILPGPATFGTRIAATGLPVNIPAGYNYMLAKFGNDSAYYWLGGQSGSLTSLFSPFPSVGGGLSHITLFSSPNPPPSVPDGGTSLGLLGIGLLALEVMRRKRAKA